MASLVIIDTSEATFRRVGVASQLGLCICSITFFSPNDLAELQHCLVPQNAVNSMN